MAEHKGTPKAVLRLPDLGFVHTVFTTGWANVEHVNADASTRRAFVVFITSANEQL